MECWICYNSNFSIVSIFWSTNKLLFFGCTASESVTAVDQYLSRKLLAATSRRLIFIEEKLDEMDTDCCALFQDCWSNWSSERIEEFQLQIVDICIEIRRLSCKTRILFEKPIFITDQWPHEVTNLMQLNIQRVFHQMRVVKFYMLKI